MVLSICVESVAVLVKPSSVICTRLLSRFNALKASATNSSFDASFHIETPCESQIGRSIVRTKKRISPVAGQAIIRGIAILIRVAEDTSIYRPATANRQNSGQLPIIEEAPE